MQVYTTVLYTLVGLAKFIGMLAFGVGLGWLMLDAYKSSTKPWQTQVMFLAGFFAFLIVLALHVHVGLGGFGIGFAVAVFMWGLPRKPKTEE